MIIDIYCTSVCHIGVSDYKVLMVYFFLFFVSFHLFKIKSRAESIEPLNPFSWLHVCYHSKTFDKREKSPLRKLFIIYFYLLGIFLFFYLYFIIAWNSFYLRSKYCEGFSLFLFYLLFFFMYNETTFIPFLWTFV